MRSAPYAAAIVALCAAASGFVACDDATSTSGDTSDGLVADATQDTAAADTAGPDTSGPDVTGTSTTAGVLCAYSQSVLNSDESVNATSTAAWSCTDTTRSLAANGLPDHEVGTFPNANNPNAITAQTVAVDFPMAPAITSQTGTTVITVAYCLNGVKFEVGTAGTCTDAGACSAIGNGGAWRMEAVGEGSFDFGNDDSHGHVQPTGTYHYHGIPEGFLTKLGKGQAVTLVGWAVDGFPIYARYGYSTPTDASSPVKVVTGSYVLKTAGDPGRPSTDIYPMGAFTQDWSYSAGSGDLDECNGRFGVTPEFPDGIYHYYLTDSFPFGQRCVKGAVTGGGGPGGPGVPGAGVAQCADVPAGMPCCGDGVCGGPETKANCPADCK
ncbi:MAG: YHYH protein [Myxococcota bacterium]